MSIVSLVALAFFMIAVMSINVQAQERTTSQSDWTDAVDRACPGCVIWETISTFTCSQEWYTIELIKPWNLPNGSNGRIIKVTTQSKQFHAHANEVPPLGWFSSNPLMGYHINNLWYHDWDSPYCDRQGYPLKNTTVYWIEQANSANYDGETNVLFDSNLDSYDREQLVATFNQNVTTPNLNTVPMHCQECRGDVDPGDDDDGGFSPWTYTSADWTEHDLWEIGSDDNDDVPGRPPIDLDEAVADKEITARDPQVDWEADAPLAWPAQRMENIRETFQDRWTITDEDKNEYIAARRQQMEINHQLKTRDRDTHLQTLPVFHKKTYTDAVAMVSDKITQQTDIDRLSDKIEKIDTLIQEFATPTPSGQIKLIIAVLLEVQMHLEEQLQNIIESQDIPFDQLDDTCCLDY